METGQLIYRFGDCELDQGRQELRRGGVPCHLEPQVFAVLAYLVRHRDRVVSRTELLDEIWGSRFVTDSALASRVKAARRAVGDSGRDQQVIRTLHGRGFRFLAPVQELTPAAAPAPAAAPLPGEAAAPAGRAAELGRLGDWYGLAERGRRQLVFVTGEAGIGKTTLLEAFAAAVADGRTGRVARGQCLEQRGAPEPYLPVFDALQRLCRDDPEALGLLSAVAPTWLVQPPSLVADGDRAALERRAPGGTQGRMLREAAEVLEAVARDRPLLLVAGTYRPGGADGAPIGDAAEHGFPIRAAQAAIFAGWALAVTGGDAAAVEQLRAGLAAYLATGAELDHPYYLGLLAEALAATAGPAVGLGAVEAAIGMVGTERPFYYLPELHRVRGDLLAQDPASAGQAAEAYGRAMELAAGHGARSAELRAAVRLCRLPARSRPEGTLARVRRLYAGFEEGFGTPDLRAAEALLGDAKNRLG
jgi:DNA-binding winged helix-turn-helix (wHTH) protein/energy-coupling factor transporter ATP-binding protein EcfA2